MQNEKGFTLVELLVSLSIIAIMSGIITVDVGSYIEKAQNTSIIANMNNIMKAGTIYISEHGNYTGFLTDPSYLETKKAILSIYYIVPAERTEKTGKAYCVCYFLKGGEDERTLCIDSYGYKKELDSSRNCTSRCNPAGICDLSNMSTR